MVSVYSKEEVKENMNTLPELELLLVVIDDEDISSYLSYENESMSAP